MRSVRRAEATGTGRLPRAAVGQGEGVERALGEGRAEGVGEGIGEGVGVASTVHTVTLGLLLSFGVAEVLAVRVELGSAVKLKSDTLGLALGSAVHTVTVGLALGIGVAQALAVKVALGSALPLTLALRVGHRLTSPAPPAPTR